MRQKIRVFKAGLSFSKTLPDGPWAFETRDLDAVARALGEDVLVALQRCFVWADRLQSLLSFGYHEKEPKRSMAHERNLHFTAWTGGGILFEAAEAVNDLNTAGVAALLQDPTDWRKLLRMARRWRKNRLLVRVRQNLAFHVDRKLMRLGTDMLLKGLGKTTSLRRVIRIMAHDHAHLTGHLQAVFSGALRGCGVM